MSLNITNLLTTLKNFYDTQNESGSKSDATKDKIDAALKSAYGLEQNWSDIADMTDVELTKDNLSTEITLDNGKTVKVSSEIIQNFSYKKTSGGTIIIYGSNLTIDMPANEQNFIEVVGVSNTINTNKLDDEVSIIGYGNIVNSGDNTDDGDGDVVNTIGGDTTSKETEQINVFNNVTDDIFDETTESELFNLDELSLEVGATADVTNSSGKFTVTDDNSYIDIEGKKYTISINHTEDDDEEKITSVDVSYEINDGVITFTGDNICITANNNQDDVIKLVGKNCQVLTDGGNDDITIEGDENVIDTGSGLDKITIKGSSNEITTDNNDADEDDDIVNITSGSKNKIDYAEDIAYTGNSATILLKSDDNSNQYINVGGYKYLVQRNPNGAQKENDDIEVSYTYNETTGSFEFTGNNFIVTSQNIEETEKIADTIKVTGDNVGIYTGNGNDTITVYGDNGTIDGGDGTDKLTLFGTVEDTSENILNIETYGDTITLTSKNQWQTITVGDKTYTFSAAVELSTTTTDSSGKTTTVENDPVTIEYSYNQETGVLTVTGNDIILKAGKDQEDNIKLTGNHSKIFALDRNDTIEVVGDNNYVDGWTGNDTIIAKGKNNKAYGFLGDDYIEIEEDATATYTDDEIKTAKESISTTDDDGNDRDEATITELAKESLQEKYASTVDGEFGKDTVKSNSYYTNVTVDTEIFKSLKQKMIITPDEKEKEIVVQDGDTTKTYIVQNYASAENPFTVNRTISYDLVEDETTGVKQLVVSAPDGYIKVVAKDGQEDNVKIIGNNSYLELGDLDDALEVEGNYNLLFGGLGNDYIKVIGDNNEIKGGDKTKGKDDVKDKEDTAYIDGDNNTWSDIETIVGNKMNGETLTNDNRSTEIKLDNGKTYAIKVNIDEEETMTENVSFTYNYDETEKVLNIKGNNLYIVAKEGQEDSIKLEGTNCVVELGDKDDYIYVDGSATKILGGDGDDQIEVYGQNFEVEGNAGKNYYNIMAANSTITGNSDDKLDMSGNDTNTVNGITDINKTPEKGVVILTPEKDENGKIICDKNGNPQYNTCTIKYQDEDEDNITLYVTQNNTAEDKTTETIFVDYEVVEIDGKKQIVVKGDNVNVRVDGNISKTVNMKVVGSNNYIQTGNGSDDIDIVGDSNKITASNGENKVTVEGNKNTIYGGEEVDTFIVTGDENNIIGDIAYVKMNGTGIDYDNVKPDEITLVGDNNSYMSAIKAGTQEGSVTLTENNTPCILNLNVKVGDKTVKRTFKLELNNVEDKYGKEINVQYSYDEDNNEVVFKCSNVAISVRDVEETETTDGLYADKIATDNQDSIRLIGDNCYIFSGFGSDVIKVEGNNNTLDGWYGDDSFQVINGNNNKILAFDGDDEIIIDGGTGHSVDGEAGDDTITIGEKGSMPEYVNVESVIDNRKKTENTV